jgi:hypothetical protein
MNACTTHINNLLGRILHTFETKLNDSRNVSYRVGKRCLTENTYARTVGFEHFTQNLKGAFNAKVTIKLLQHNNNLSIAFFLKSFIQTLFDLFPKRGPVLRR